MAAKICGQNPMMWPQFYTLISPCKMGGRIELTFITYASVLCKPLEGWRQIDVGHAQPTMGKIKEN